MLAGRTALVTGSTSGIGLGIARALARSGANIVINGFGDRETIGELMNDFLYDYLGDADACGEAGKTT